MVSEFLSCAAACEVGIFATGVVFELLWFVTVDEVCGAFILTAGCVCLVGGVSDIVFACIVL